MTSVIQDAKIRCSYQPPWLYKRDSASQSRYNLIHPFFAHNSLLGHTNLSVVVLTCLMHHSPPRRKLLSSTLEHYVPPWQQPSLPENHHYTSPIFTERIIYKYLSPSPTPSPSIPKVNLQVHEVIQTLKLL